jgi:hypothetical protein
MVRSMQPPSDWDLVTLFTDEATWRGFEERFSDRFEAEFECAGIGTPGGDLEGQGFGGLLELWREWLGPWRSYRTTIEGVGEVGDKIVVSVRDAAVPRAGDTEVELRGASVWTLRGGRVARVEFFTDREAAMRSATVEP